MVLDLIFRIANNDGKAICPVRFHKAVMQKEQNAGDAFGVGFDVIAYHIYALSVGSSVLFPADGLSLSEYRRHPGRRGRIAADRFR